MNLLPNNPFFASYQQYNTQFPQIETIGGMLYDTVLYMSGVSVSLNFFTAGPRASFDLTNMEIPSQLAAPKAFLVRAFRFYVKQAPMVMARVAAGTRQTGAFDNIAQLTNDGVLTLTIGSKPYALFPLWMIPAGGGPYPMLGATGATADPGLHLDYANNGSPFAANALVLSQPLFIAPQINFSVNLSWPGAITLAPNNTNTSLCVVMDGDILRPVQ